VIWSAKAPFELFGCFLQCEVVGFLVFIFVEVGSFQAPGFRAELGIILTRGLNSGLSRLILRSTWIRALRYAVSQRTSSPCG
jgi:hypothetical protein